MAYPKDYKYTKEHEWVKGATQAPSESPTTRRIAGRYCVRRTAEGGRRLETGKSFGTVESVKAVSDLYAPVSGKVTEVNEDLEPAPEKVNNDAHGLDDQAGDHDPPVARLLSADDYEKYVAEEAGH